MDWTIQGGMASLMGRCIEQLRDEVVTFVNVRCHRSVIPVPISALHYRDIAFKKQTKKKKKRGIWKWVDKDQDKEEPWPTPLPLEKPLRVLQGELSKCRRVEMHRGFQLFKAHFNCRPPCLTKPPSPLCKRTWWEKLQRSHNLRRCPAMVGALERARPANIEFLLRD